MRMDTLLCPWCCVLVSRGKFLMKLYQHETSGNIFSRSYVSNSVKLLKCCLNVSLLWESSILQAQNSFKLPKNIQQIIIKGLWIMLQCTARTATAVCLLLYFPTVQVACPWSSWLPWSAECTDCVGERGLTTPQLPVNLITVWQSQTASSRILGRGKVLKYAWLPAMEC